MISRAETGFHCQSRVNAVSGEGRAGPSPNSVPGENKFSRPFH